MVPIWILLIAICVVAILSTAGGYLWALRRTPEVVARMTPDQLVGLAKRASERRRVTQ